MNVSASDEITDDARARSNVVRLAAAQALTGANSAVIFATGSIVGATLAPDISFATVPLSMYVVGLAAGTLPTGAISRAYGRRVAFIIGYEITPHSAAAMKRRCRAILNNGRPPCRSAGAGFGASTPASTTIATSATTACAAKLKANR